MGPSPGTSLGPGGPATATDGAAPQPERRCIAITAEEATLQPSGTAPATCPRNRHRKEARIGPHRAGNKTGNRVGTRWPAAGDSPETGNRSGAQWSRKQARNPVKPGTGRAPYLPDGFPRADAGPSVRNPQSATRMRHPTSPASAGVFRNESRPNAPQTSQNQPPHAATPGAGTPPTVPRQPFRTLDTTLRNPPASPASENLSAAPGPLRPPEKRKPAPHAAPPGARTPPPAPLQPLLSRIALPNPPATPAPGNHLAPYPMPHRSSAPPAAPPPRNSASPAPENRPAAGYLSAPAASTHRNTLPRDLFRSRKRALTFADKQSYV